VFTGKIRQISVSKSYEMVYRHFEKFATKRFKRFETEICLILPVNTFFQSTLIASTLPNKIMMMVKSIIILLGSVLAIKVDWKKVFTGKIRQISVSKSYEMVYRHFEKYNRIR
jgi:hypothetical protein